LAIGIEEGLVQFDSQRKVYLLGTKVFDLVRNAYGGYDIQAVALDEMMNLHGEIDANVTLGVPNGLEVIYLRIIEANRSMGSNQRPGMREPFHCSASGKAIMAFLPESEVAAKLESHKFERFTERTITNADAFKAALQVVRQVGYATNDREEYDHLGGISAPIFNYLGEPIAVINIWSLQSHYALKDLVGWSDKLLATSRRVTSLIGGQDPQMT